MTSSNGNIFRGPRWIPRTKANDAELWCFFDRRLNKRLSKNHEAVNLRRYRAHYDVTVVYKSSHCTMIEIISVIKKWEKEDIRNEVGGTGNDDN